MDRSTRNTTTALAHREPGAIIEQFDDGAEALAYMRRLGESDYTVTPGIEKCYAVRKLCPPGTEPGLRVHEAEIALARQVRAMAQWLLDGGAREELKTGPEWQQLRALYVHYCGGLEDALYEKTAVLAAAIRAGKAAWLGDIVLDAWNAYADEKLEQRVAAKAAELGR